MLHCSNGELLAILVVHPFQTFSLMMTNGNADGTTSVMTSIPCAAGSDTDICVIQVCPFHACIQFNTCKENLVGGFFSGGTQHVVSPLYRDLSGLCSDLRCMVLDV